MWKMGKVSINHSICVSLCSHTLQVVCDYVNRSWYFTAWRELCCSTICKLTCICPTPLIESIIVDAYDVKHFGVHAIIDYSSIAFQS